MKWIIICTIIILAGVFVIIKAGVFSRSNSNINTTMISTTTQQIGDHTTPVTEMKLQSSAFSESANIPPKYTCDGNEINPPLNISGVPTAAKSLAITLEDPDTSMGTFDHWVMYNIDPTTRVIAEGAYPIGEIGKATTGDLTYLGPCPPTGSHRYIFTVYAVDKMLSFKEPPTKAELLEAISAHVVGMAKLMGKYSRTRN